MLGLRNSGYKFKHFYIAYLFYTLSYWARLLTFWLSAWTTVLYGAFSKFLKLDHLAPIGAPKTPHKAPNFQHFLIELGCWNFGCVLKEPFCIRFFSIFLNRAPLPSLGPPERILPPKKSNSSFIARFLWNLKNNILVCLSIIIEIEINDPPS